MRLDLPLDRALGSRTAHALADSLGLNTVGDLLHHYPRRYVERGALTPLAALQTGEHVTVVAEVRSSEVRRSRQGKQVGEVVVTDGSGAELRLAFFGRGTFRMRHMPVGVRGLFAGQVTEFRGVRQLTHPEFEPLAADEDERGFAEQLVPLYPATRAIASWNIAKAVRTLLDTVEVGPDPLPADLVEQHGLPGLAAALQAVHRPASRAELRRAQQRLRWDEAYVLQVVLAQRRAAAQGRAGVPRPGRPDGALAAFNAMLPFLLTAGQREVGERLAAELAGRHPMHRLLQGEVGSGKTVVALRAMLQVVDSQGQAALLAPTEVLAQQHARSLRALLGPLGEAGELGAAPHATRVALLTGSLGAAARRDALEQCASGAAGIVVGTHALLSEGVEFADLGLVVVDEQHRFGVEQRDALRGKGSSPHLLVMTATPIPRTVAMTVFGDLETSTLRELPAGRSPITTHVVGLRSTGFARTWEKVREQVAGGQRAYVVCARITTGDQPQEPAGELPLEPARAPAAAVEDVLTRLLSGPLAGLRVAALHGRLPAEEKEQVMRRFTSGELDVLVATTVVEVGVDVPEATVMVVLDADRFGVSQLHQLRGRVGRGSAPGLCVLVTDVDPDTPAGERLRAVAGTTDGFALAQVDLEQRREGDVLGAAQSGRRSSLRLLRLSDVEVIEAARAAASQLVSADPDLQRHPALAEAVASVLDEQRAAFLEKA